MKEIPLTNNFTFFIRMMKEDYMIRVNKYK